MGKKIVYTNESGFISVIVPSPKWQGTLETLGKKDVPTGNKFKIIDDSDLPPDRILRSAWTIDDSFLTDGVGE